MSFRALQARIAEQGQMAAGAYAPMKIGLVTSYNGDAGAHWVKVKLQPEEIETGWLPIKLLMAGPNFGVYVGPSIGDQAVISFHDGDALSGICIGFLGNDDDTPPEVLTGEIHLIAKGETPAKIKLDAAGNIASAGVWTHTGKLTVTDDVTLQAKLAAAGDVTLTGSSVKHGGKEIGKTHTHSDPQGGVTGQVT